MLFVRVESFSRWGWFRILFKSPWLVIKLLKFKPYSKLSYQKHLDRNELWFFLKGNKGEMILANEQETNIQYIRSPLLNFGQIVLVKRRHWHQFINPSAKSIFILEIQYGRIVHETDIIRKA